MEKHHKAFDSIPDNLRYHQHRVAVTKEFQFDAAHKLYLYEGKCKQLHGHTYRLLITLSGRLDAKGMVIDFSEIKALFQNTVKERLDHQYLNEALPPMNTTVENIIVWIWKELEKEINTSAVYIKRKLRIEELTLYETAGSFATLKREWMQEKEDA